MANEVRKLANQSGDAVKSITDIINSIYKDTQRTEQMIENSTLIYTRQGNAVHDTEDIFNDINSNTETIMNGVQLVYKLIDGMNGLQTEAFHSITSIAAIAQETAATIEEINASGQEQLTTANHLVQMSFQIDGIITSMKGQMDKFTIG